jgi:hypothetical protein
MTPLKNPRPVQTRCRFRTEVPGSRQEFDAEARDVSIEGLRFSSPILLKIRDRAGIPLCFQGRPTLSVSVEDRHSQFRIAIPKMIHL